MIVRSNIFYLTENRSKYTVVIEIIMLPLHHYQYCCAVVPYIIAHHHQRGRQRRRWTPAANKPINLLIKMRNREHVEKD